MHAPLVVALELQPGLEDLPDQGGDGDGVSHQETGLPAASGAARLAAAGTARC